MSSRDPPRAAATGLVTRLVVLVPACRPAARPALHQAPVPRRLRRRCRNRRQCARRGGPAVVQRSVHDSASLQYQRMSVHAWPPSGTSRPSGRAMPHKEHWVTSSRRSRSRCVGAGGPPAPAGIGGRLFRSRFRGRGQPVNCHTGHVGVPPKVGPTQGPGRVLRTPGRDRRWLAGDPHDGHLSPAPAGGITRYHWLSPLAHAHLQPLTSQDNALCTGVWIIRVNLLVSAARLWTTGAVEMWITAAASSPARSRAFAAVFRGSGFPADLTLSDQHEPDLTPRAVRHGNRGGPPAELAVHNG